MIMKPALLFAPIASLAANYVVQLRPDASLSKLLTQADTVETQTHLRSSVMKSIEIGDSFKCFVADLDDQKLAWLEHNPEVYDILPNQRFKVFEDEIVHEGDRSEDEDLSITHEVEDEDIDDAGTSDLSEEDDKDGFGVGVPDHRGDNTGEEPEKKSYVSAASYGDDEYEENLEGAFLEVVNDGEDDKEDDDEQDADDDDSEIKVQYDAPRHLARLSSREGLWTRDEPYSYTYKETGKGVVVYVLDTGVAIDHPELEGRAVYGANFIDGEPDYDFQGHGTHVAGIVASKSYGVAKKSKIVAVKVLSKDGGGDMASVISGLEYAANDRAERGVKGVANLSLGSVQSSIVNEAVRAAVKTGLVVVVAAGNSNAPAMFFSPASEPSAITVGALDDRTDTVAIFSNYGPELDVFASGVDVVSLNNRDFSKPIAYSGTSMASPVVAGLAATFLEAGVDNTEIQHKITSKATEGVISVGFKNKVKYSTSPNKVAYNGYGSDIGSLEQSPFDQDMALVELIQNDPF